MSRIHEALKRAEKDRINQGTDAAPISEQSSAAPADTAPLSSGASSAEAVPPSLEMPSVFADRTAERNTERYADHASILNSTLHPDATPRLHGQQFIRFDDVWQVSSVPGWHFDSHVSVFADPTAAPLAAEQFRTLRSRLTQIRDRRPLKSVLITSGLASEGKTFVATNLAQSLARQQGCKVLLIDGDLRAPGLHSALGAPLTPGLSDYLRGTASDTTILQRGVADLLCLIPAGNRVENPSELIANGQFKTLLEKLAPLFDWVVIDSPPILPVSDAAVLADSCDGVLSVIRAAFTDLDSAQKACAELQDKNLLGVVLNCAEEGAAYAQYGSYATASGRTTAMAASA